MKRNKPAFSLIELLIVLAILAAVTTIAIRATTGLQDQARYQATVRELNDIQTAIVGPTNQRNPDGSALVTGFVADTGRLPWFYISGSDPLGTNGDPLNELIANPNGIVPYQSYASNVDPTVKVWVGWQGPYLRLSAGPSYTRDGWGNSLHAYDGSGNLISAAGTAIAQIASWGADNQADVNHEGSVAIAGNYNDDISLPNPTITNTTSGFAYTTIITGQVTMNTGVDPGPATSGPTPNSTYASNPVSIWVDYIGPDINQSPNPVGDLPVLVAVGSGSAWTNYYNWPATSAGVGGPYSGQFVISAANFTGANATTTNVTIGPRVLKVYLLASSVTTVSAFKSAVRSGPIYASTPLNVTLVPGTRTINPVLPHYSP